MNESNPFSVIGADDKPHHYSSLSTEERERIAGTHLTIYVCEGTESEIKNWFRTINIKGFELKPQEMRNAAYSGPFVTAWSKGGATDEKNCQMLCKHHNRCKGNA